VEQGNETFLYDGQYYSVEVAESIIIGHLNGHNTNMVYGTGHGYE